MVPRQHPHAECLQTKDLIVVFRRTQQHQRIYTQLGINGTAVERLSFRYLGVHIAEDMTWTTHIDTLPVSVYLIYAVYLLILPNLPILLIFVIPKKTP